MTTNRHGRIPGPAAASLGVVLLPHPAMPWCSSPGVRDFVALRERAHTAAYDGSGTRRAESGRTGDGPSW
ncbi:hypothetical protein ACWCRD_37945 [Streptomyces sp. NPDC002092]